ncbi:hypothetical protein [Embleya sp. NPDC001921]
MSAPLTQLLGLLALLAAGGDEASPGGEAGELHDRAGAFGGVRVMAMRQPSEDEPAFRTADQVDLADLVGRTERR